MGTAGSIPYDEDGDLTDNANPGVIKRIPIEVPSRHRGTFGGALRSVGSFGLGGRSRAKGVSLRSAMSMDLDSSEVDKVRRDFEMYKISKQNERSDLVKKEKKLESENRRLRAELQALQKTCNKLMLEKDGAREAEYQALERASTFELDRNKVQRQFKIFRETKESEIRDLMKKTRHLETLLQKTSPHTVQIIEDGASGASGNAAETGNPGDWWAPLESEPSLGSMSQLQPSSRVPEPMPHLVDIDNNFYNKGGETTLSAAVWNEVVMSLPSTSQFNVVRVYVSAPKDMHTEVELLKQECDVKMRHICNKEGRFFVFVHLPNSDKTTDEEWVMLNEVHLREVQQCSVFVSFLGEHTNRFTTEEFDIGHLNDPGARPAIFCFRNSSFKGCKNSQGEAKELKEKIRGSGCAKLIDNYSNPQEGAEKAFTELERVVKLELGQSSSSSESDAMPSELDDSLENLCGSYQCDINYSGEQVEAHQRALISTCELGFEKHYERLNEHVAAAGPLPPFLISGTPGSGKSLLLAKWISLQQRRNSSSLVLYHFVGNAVSSSASTVNMIRRLTAQLMKYASNPPTLTSEPNRLLDEFPKWLERISTKIKGGVILVLDSLDLFQNAESQLQWLLDPLPIDARVIVSANPDNCCQAWRSWPTLHLEPLSPRLTKELVHALCLTKNFTLSSEDESRILSHCRMPATRHPLYVTVLIDELIHSDKTMPVREKLDMCLKYAETAELYRYVLESLERDHEGYMNHKGMIKRICQLIYMSRNGMAECELFDLIPNLTWNFLAPLCHDLLDRNVLTYRAGALIFAHEQAREAVQLNYCLGLNEQDLQSATKSIIQYHIKALKMPVGAVTARVADELPWLLQTYGDMERLQQCVTNQCIFRLLYQRGCCAELLDYWQIIGKDKQAMADIYFEAIKSVEQMDTPLVTLARVADMYALLGRFLKDLNLLNRAVRSFQRSLEIRESVDPDHPVIAQSFHLLGGLYAQWGKYGTAEAYYKQALEVIDACDEEDDDRTARMLESLAVLYRKQNKLDQAEPIHKRASAIRKKCQPVHIPPHKANALNALKKRALQLEDLTTGSDSVELARTLNELGVLYYLQNNHSIAEKHLKRSLAMREHLLPPDHLDIVQSLNNLAALYNDGKDYEKAERFYERALLIRKRVFPMDHPTVVASVRNLGMLYRKQGKYEEAEPLYQAAVESREKCLGPNHPSVATALVNLAVIYCQRGKHNKALPLYERALKIYEDSFGPHHSRVAETLRNLAVLRYEQGDFQTAASLYKRSTDIKEMEMTYTQKSFDRQSSSGESSNMRPPIAMSPQLMITEDR